MSKSKKNVIDPEFIIENYGADSVRLFILSDSPPEKDVQWSEQGMLSSYKFVQKLWTLHSEIKNKILNEKKINIDIDFDRFTNQIIEKITNNLEKFNYNVIIANMYETYNYLINYIKNNTNIKNLEINYNKLLVCFLPVLPHFASECLDDVGKLKNISWPEYDNELLKSEEINFVVQINGKKKTILKLKKDVDESDVLKAIKSDSLTSKHLNNRNTKKIIFVKNRLINILLDE